MLNKLSRYDIDFFKTKKGERFVKQLAKYIIADAIRYQSIDPRGKSPKQIHEDILKYLLDIAHHKVNISLVVDYRQLILSEARSYKKENELFLSCILYAVWLEHWINSIIVVFCKRRKISPKETKQILKNANINAKFTWIPHLLGIPLLSKNHIKGILHFFELRNHFVHYKWESKEEHADDKFDHDLESSISNIDFTVKYLVKYENKVFFMGRKRKVLNLV